MNNITSNHEVIEKKVLYAKAIYGMEERVAVLKSMDNGWLANGPLVKQFEEEIAKLFGKKYGIAVNSGSSADLLSILSLRLPFGSEIITPACTFSTAVSSILNAGLIPRFVDSVIGRYTINERLVDEAIGENTKAILVPQLVGGVCDMKVLSDIALRHGLFLIDDSCDTLAPYLNDTPVATYSDITTTSFYGSHIITALGMGGMALTDSEELAKRIRVLRDWGRVGDDREDFESRFNYEIDGIPYDNKFLYADFGYNMKMNEASAAFGLEQLKRLPEFLRIREENFNALRGFFSQYSEYFYLPYLVEGAKTNWLAFPLTIRDDAPFTRKDMLRFLENAGIQTRVLFSGNITRHPAYLEAPKIIYGDLFEADRIMARGFLLGAHQGMTKEDVLYICNIAKKFLEGVHENSLP